MAVSATLTLGGRSGLSQSPSPSTLGDVLTTKGPSGNRERLDTTRIDFLKSNQDFSTVSRPLKCNSSFERGCSKLFSSFHLNFSCLNHSTSSVQYLSPEFNSLLVFNRRLTLVNLWTSHKVRYKKTGPTQNGQIHPSIFLRTSSGNYRTF